jgi:hypothetical protein
MPIRKLLRRLKRGGKTTTEFTNWGSLHAEVDAQFQLIGAAIIGSWEILLTDVARSFRQHHSNAMPNALSQRLSDAIVPLQQCAQGRSKQIQHAITQHAQHPDQPFFAMSDLMIDFPAKLSESWRKSCGYVEDVFSENELQMVHQQWLAAEEGLLLGARALQAHFVDPFSDLESARQRIVSWREAMVRLIEIELYARRAELCKGLSN